MSKDPVRLLKLQTVGASAPPPGHRGTDESFSVIRQELDALASKVCIVSEHTDELERKLVSQADELGALRRAVEEREATRRKLEDEVSSLQAQLYHGLDYIEEGNTSDERGEARDMPIEALPGPNFDEVYTSAETGFPENLNIKDVPTQCKQEGTDWFAVFNPDVKRVLDITLAKTFNLGSPVRCVRLSPDMKCLAAACGTTVHVYNAETGKQIWICPTNKTAKSACFNPDSNILAVGSNDGQVYIWEIATREIRYTFCGPSAAGITSLCFSSDGKVLVSGSRNGTAQIWSLGDGTSITIATNSGSVRSITIISNELLALGCRNGSIEVWNVKDRKPNLNETILGHESAVRSLAFSRHKGNRLLSGSDDRSLKHWNVTPLLDAPKALAESSGAGGGESVIQCNMSFTGHKGSVTSLAITHDSQWVVSGSYDHCVRFWDSETASLHCTLKGHRDFVLSVDPSQTGSILVTGSRDGQVRLWTFK